MASLGVALMQHRAQEAKIQKSALQIQQLLQAGMAYYADNSAWPTLGKPQAGLPDFNKYLPENADTFPWGNTYQVGPDSDKPKLLDVETPAIDKKTAERIAALLPNAEPIANGSGWSVLAQTTQPEKGGGSDTTINTTGNITLGTDASGAKFDAKGIATKTIQIDHPCPANESMQMLLVPKYIQMQPPSSKWASSTPIVDNLKTSSSCDNTIGSCTITIQLQSRTETTTTDPEAAGTEVDINYLTLCTPKT